jgi:hypothetical protein
MDFALVAVCGLKNHFFWHAAHAEVLCLNAYTSSEVHHRESFAAHLPSWLSPSASKSLRRW